MALHKSLLLGCVPVDFFDVVIHGRRQTSTTTRPASLQNFASITALHTLAETMNANTTTTFGLVGTLWHFESFFKKRALGAVSSR
jgi:hypothetical protein